MVNNATNVGFRETYVKTKEDDVRTRVASDEALLMTVKSTPTYTVILVVVMGVLSSFIPALNESRVLTKRRRSSRRTPPLNFLFFPSP